MANREPKLLEVCVGKAQGLADLVDYAADSIVSKTIIDKQVGSVTLFAFDKGQKLSEHTSPYDAVLQGVDGGATLAIGGNQVRIGAGEIIIMPANVPHAVNADQKFKMLLIMVRG